MGAEKMTLDELHIGDSGVIATVGGEGALRRRLLDMGLTPKTRVTVRKMAPMGDPIEIRVRGYELTLRVEEAQKIEVEGDNPRRGRQKNRDCIRQDGIHQRAGIPPAPCGRPWTPPWT